MSIMLCALFCSPRSISLFLTCEGKFFFFVFNKKKIVGSFSVFSTPVEFQNCLSSSKYNPVGIFCWNSFAFTDQLRSVNLQTLNLLFRKHFWDSSYFRFSHVSIDLVSPSRLFIFLVRINFMVFSWYNENNSLFYISFINKKPVVNFKHNNSFLSPLYFFPK